VREGRDRSLSDGENEQQPDGTERPLSEGQGRRLSDGGNCSPALEFDFAVRAAQLTFRAVDDVHIRTEGTARVERATQRDGLPRPVTPGVRYADVRLSSQLSAWLDEARRGQNGQHAPAEGKHADGKRTSERPSGKPRTQS
jgi:hypothetical protein